MNLLKRYVISVFLCVSILLGSALMCAATENARSYLDGIKLCQEGHYEKAISEFENIAETGIVNGELFYNIGNTYFKTNDIGHCILWYERALKLIPNDPDLKFNYQYVRGLVKDKIEDKASPLFKVLFFWKHILGKKTIQWAGIGLFFVFWFMIIVQMIKKRRLLRIPSVIILSLAIVFILTSVYDFYNDTYNKSAIIMSKVISVRSGLTENSTELFLLHTGTKVRIEAQRREYVKISVSGGKIGWMKKEYLEII